MFVAQYIKP